MDKKDRLKLLGENLKRSRERQNLTQEQIAEMAGISTSFYTNIERGNKGVSIFVLISLAEALNVSVESLLYQEEPRRQINNIEILLRDKPASFISAVEKMIRLCHDEFYHDSRDSHDS